MRVKVYVRKDGEGFVETRNRRLIEQGARDLEDHQLVVNATENAYPVTCIAMGSVIVVRN
jgi:hypothetical protein